MEKEKKLLGSKKILFGVIKNSEDDDKIKTKKEIEEPKKKNDSPKNKIEKLQITNIHSATDNFGKNINLSSDQPIKINSSNSSNNDTFNKTEDKIEIISDFINWKDKSSITFSRVVKKYYEKHADNINKQNFNNNSPTLSEIEINNSKLENKEFIFKLYLNENPNIYTYTYEDVKNTTVQYLEKKHNSKIKKITIEVLEKRDFSEISKNLDEYKLEKYKKHLKNLLDPLIVDNENFTFISMVDSFFEEFPQFWDNFENLAIQNISEIYHFQDLSAYIYLYLYDNLKKLKDPKLLENLKNKIKENSSGSLPKNLNYFTKEMMTYYNKRQEKMKNCLSKNIKVIIWNEENSLTEIFLTTFIYNKFKSVTEVDLTQHYILNENILTVFSALKLNKSVNKLLLNSNKIGEEGMWQLSRVLTYNKNLSDLDLSMNLLGDDSLKALLLGLNEENYKNVIKINNNNLIETTSELELIKLESMSFYNGTFPLIKLNLSNNSSLTAESGKYIAKIIELSPNLKSLNLSKNSIDVLGYSSICNTIKRLTIIKKCKLENLILFQTKISQETISLFSEILALPYCSIKSLTLSDSKFELNSAIQFFKSLQINKSLEELLLMNCDIGNDIAEYIYQMILVNSNLIVLNLYNNKIDSPIIFKNILKVFRNKQNKFTNEIVTPNQNDFNFLSDDVCDQFFNISGTPLENIYDLKDVQPSIAANSFNDTHNVYETLNNNLNQPTNFFSNEDYHTNKSSTINEHKLLSGNLRKLKYLDLSKNKCKLTIDRELIEIIEKLELESLDISQNFDFPTGDENTTKKFKEAITKIQDKTKIIY